MPIVLKSGSLNLLELSGPVQACNGIALPLLYITHYLLIQDKHILLIVDIIFSVLFGPDEYLQISECPAVLWSVISEDFLFPQHQGGYVLLTPNKSPEYNEIPPDKVWEKAVNYNLAFYGARYEGEKGTFE